MMEFPATATDDRIPPGMFALGYPGEREWRTALMVITVNGQRLVDAGLVDGWPEWQVRIARAAALGERLVWQPARRHGVATAKREIAELFRAAGYEVMEATPGPIRGNQANRVWVDEITGGIHTDGKW